MVADGSRILPGCFSGANGLERLHSAFGGNIEIFMKQVYSSPDSAQVGLAHSLLDAAGIACEVRSDAVSQVMPGMPFVTELWVLKDDDCEESRRLIPGDSE